MRKIEQLTAVSGRQCVKFRPKAASDPYSTLIQPGAGCSSHVRCQLFIYCMPRLHASVQLGWTTDRLDWSANTDAGNSIVAKQGTLHA